MFILSGGNTMSISRRKFLKVSGGVVAGLAIPGRGDAATETEEVRIKGKTTTTLRCFCAVAAVPSRR
jgi:hypothetical protein